MTTQARLVEGRLDYVVFMSVQDTLCRPYFPHIHSLCQVTSAKLINSSSLLHKTLRSMSCSCVRIDPLHLTTALCFVEVIIDLLHALPEQVLLHWIGISRHFVVIFVRTAIQICVQVKLFIRVEDFA